MKAKVISFVSALCILIVALFYYFNYEEKLISGNDRRLINNLKKDKLHFALIVQNTNDPFWKAVETGARNASKKFNVQVEFMGPRFSNMSEELKYLDISIASKVDGIATHIFNEEKFAPLVNKAVKLKIPVITVESDIKNSGRNSFVGTSNYQIGQEGGKLLNQVLKNNADVAMIINSYNNSNEDVEQNLKVLGFKSAIRTGNFKLRTIRNSSIGVFSAGEIVQDIIKKYPTVKALFCTNSRDTVEVAQTLIDLNMVGQIKIIGFGNLPEIIKYIKNGVVYGSVATNPEIIGFQSVKLLYELRMKKTVSSYIDTGAYSITQKNMKDVVNQGGDYEK